MLSYRKLWDLLETRGMKKNDLLDTIAPATVAKLGKNASVNTDTIDKLCERLKCQPGDIVEHISDKELNKVNEQLKNMNQVLEAMFKGNPELKKTMLEQFADGSEAKELFEKGDFFGSSIIDEALKRKSLEDEEKKDPTE